MLDEAPSTWEPTILDARTAMIQKRRMSRLLTAIDGWLVEHLGPFARTAFSAALVTALVLIAGLFGSLYTDDIKAAFPFVLGHGPLSVHAMLFWASALGATLLFFVGQRTSEIDRRASEARLDQRSDKLEGLIRTIPPTDFLFTFGEIFWECGQAWWEIINSKTEITAGAVEEAIRIVLGGAAKLAKKFDAALPDVIYAANVMLFIPSERLNDKKIAEVKDSLRFADAETDLRALKGVLILERELSTTTVRGTLGQRDDSLVPLALGVPHETHDPSGRRWRVLPGAPMAFCSGGLALYVDTRTLGEWCRTEGDFPPSTATAVEEYFNDSRSASDRSFVSIPIKPLEG
ncbi:MAG: hypothetical protein WCE23_06000 [Candidatus Binatus sp.]|uniref:hypothetical protein n=1 Tax=Candidatus Binatus sp. TaxID=2811406 RepID=UPI003C756047